MCIEYRFNHQTKNVEEVAMFKLIIAGEGAALHVSLHQHDKRRINALQYFDAGVTILKEDGARNGSYTFVGSTGNAVDRQHQLQIDKGLISVGTYLLVPTSSACKIEIQRRNINVATASGTISGDAHGLHQDRGEGAIYDNSIDDNNITVRPAVISVHSDRLFSLQKTKFSRRAYELAMKLPAIHGGDQTDLFGDGSIILYTLKSGYNGNTYVAKNEKIDKYAKLDMDFSKSKNVVTNDGKYTATAIIAPGHSVMMKHMMPASDGDPWQAAWQVKAAWVDKVEFDEKSKNIMNRKLRQGKIE